MKITIVAVGRMKRGPLEAICREYSDRLPWSLAIHEVEAKKRLEGDALKAEEADLIAARIPDGAVLVALDERGRGLSSEDLARRIGDWRDQGRGEICFVLGGADGLTPSIRDRADIILAFGPQTWPHMLARVMLIEQIYRVERILAGHPYHRA